MTSPPPKVETLEPRAVPSEIPPFPYNPQIQLGVRPSTPSAQLTQNQSTPNPTSSSTPNPQNPNVNNTPNSNISIAYRSSSARRRHGPDSSLRDLQALPEVRSIPWISGRELPPEKSTESPRAQTRGAFMLSTRGKIRNPPCNHCTGGSGRFSVCVSLDNWFFGACATCQMATRGHLCSLRTAAAGSPVPRAPRQQVFKVADPTPPPPQNQPISGQNHQQPQNNLKRKADEPMMSGMRVLQPRGDNYALIAPAPQNAPQPQQSSGYAPTNSRLNTTSPAYFSDRPPNNPNNYHPPNGIPISSWGRPIEPSPYPHSLPKNNGHGKPSSTTGGYMSEILSPTPPTPASEPPIQTQAQPPSRPQNLESPEMSLIDSIPRKKQKQIFGIIGGLQSGIRSVRQQAENLQKQLDILQSALGIDSEDDTEG